MAHDERPLETFVTLVLEHVDGELARAHRELYPERIPEQIPLSLTVLYPWIPRASLATSDVEELAAFFAERPPLRFDLLRLAQFPGAVVYAVPEPDSDLRATMRSLWARYPEYPPYGKPGGDPPPHCTLGRLIGPSPITLEQAEARVGPLLPVHCDVTEATLFEEVERDVCSPLARLPFGA